MKKKIESRFEEISRYYGSIVAYNEEQRRFGLVSIEATIRANPFIQERKIAIPVPDEEVKDRPQPRRFWPRFFGQKTQSEQI